MQWTKTDINQYKEVTEYVDTLLVPLLPISFQMDSKIEKIVFQGELVKIFANELEKRFKGRILLTPVFTYLSDEEISQEAKRLNKWVDYAKENPFTHIFFLTFDSKWKKCEQELNGNLLWFPSIQSGDLQSDQIRALIKDQVNEVMDLIRSYW
ncbi:YpiF family protein [Aquibacillus koreensis]|uniref:YpiF family protein n=1 Tax=Aquibacillus koreensis TaxID=279446 RepID=A0A9X3WI49_9BACI|nr:YpiF family protein [Aquibacillus koreensis]MCT2537375.1 YpiF family protein [Aquibacillus koreensis]MDC3418821.1 YpiF family protein [Aquibacillus koreensis]